jgi:hypothetical protein
MRADFRTLPTFSDAERRRAKTALQSHLFIYQIYISDITTVPSPLPTFGHFGGLGRGGDPPPRPTSEKLRKPQREAISRVGKVSEFPTHPRTVKAR